MFLPNLWPSYFSKSNKIFVTDIDGNKYTDMICAVGTNILGYSNPDVDRSVKNAIDKGIMSTLNSFEEVELTKKLLKIHPWADMAKYCRSGGEANALAVRIARSAAKKVILQYVDTMDGMIGILQLTLKNRLKNHLLNDLKTVGVNSKLKNIVYTFDYNNTEELIRPYKN